MSRRSCNEVRSTLAKALQARGLPLAVGEELGEHCLAAYAAGRDGIAELLACSTQDLLARADQAVTAPPIIGCDVPEETWIQAQALALKTYVPSTAASRAGAGADINDSE